MINQVSYNINTADGVLQVTITPVNTPLPGGDYYATGVYKLTTGTVGLGQIVFDDDMEEWSYEGMDEFTYAEARELADFIKNYKDPAGSDPGEL